MALAASVPHIVLKKAPFPKGYNSRRDHITNLAKDPSFCSVCCNLFAGSAYSIFPRQDIFMHESTGVENARAAEIRGYHDEIVPEWAGTSRLDYASWQFGASLLDISEEAKKCSSCAILQAGIMQLGGDIIKAEGSAFEVEVVFCKGDVLRVWVFQISNAEPEVDIFGEIAPPERISDLPVLVCEFYTLPGQPCPWPTIGCSMKREDPHQKARSWEGGPVHHVLVAPTADDCCEIIRSWIDTCTREHTTCAVLEANSHSPLPKRVIDVGLDQYSIRLLEPSDEGLPINDRYIALSHCWGQSQHLTSKKANIGDRKKNIPWDLLPKTFQEAILVTRGLGVRYIWIDSLCIIQDDYNDWEIEAQKMGQIYNRAYLVIAATASIDGDGGILFTRPGHIAIDGKDEDGKSFNIYARNPCGHRAFSWGVPHVDTQRATRYRYQQTGISGYPLFTRAWCFQERLLGTRVLHFTKDEMVFECISSLDCECGAMSGFRDDWLLEPRRLVAGPIDSLDSTRQDIDENKVIGKLTGLIISKKKPGESQSLMSDEWCDMVSEYSAKQITKSSDWLPALAGLASKWPDQNAGRYLAGIWSNNMLRGLLWRPVSVGEKTKHAYIAPSWSWASIRCAVAWITGSNRSEYYVEVDLEHTACIPKGLNKFGELRTGWLLVRGPVLEATLVSISDSQDSVPTGFIERRGGYRCPFDIDDVCMTSQFLGKTIFCLWFCTDLNTNSSGGFHRALILARADGKDISDIPQNIRDSGNIYQRIGIIEYLSMDKWEFSVSQDIRDLYII